jgi:hypothetical protein
MIDITGIDKVELLRALYANAKVLGLGLLQYSAAPLTQEEAKAALAHGYIDYLMGRVMKVDLTGDTLKPSLYDRDNGEGRAAQVVAQVRAAQEKQP